MFKETLFPLRLMINFRCQFDWTTECQDTETNVIQGVSERVFLSKNGI